MRRGRLLSLPLLLVTLLISLARADRPADAQPTGTKGTLQFSSATYSVYEPAGTVTITVTREGGSSGEARGSVVLSRGSATPGVDYVDSTFVVEFDNGEATPKTFQIQILDDLLDEEDETVILTLTAPNTGVDIGEPALAVLTIVDDDSLPSLSVNDVTVPDLIFGLT